MSAYCLLWFGCMAVHRKKTVGIKVDKGRVTKTVWNPAAPGTTLPRAWSLVRLGNDLQYFKKEWADTNNQSPAKEKFQSEDSRCEN
ncbi:hypothetical protein DBR06_SOUSAS22110015 [Sousa chinensis]|uniref:Uncharacterized protein n=1 Tax=Sousa chinensis TaxID=103600 RepID=A0A484GWY4_SOUCH|nr:hypothetical protein DBR06_SOUSAS22110015 [Sousa chinensis]